MHNSLLFQATKQVFSKGNLSGNIYLPVFFTSKRSEKCGWDSSWNVASTYVRNCSNVECLKLEYGDSRI